MECGNLFPLFPRAATVSAALFPFTLSHSANTSRATAVSAVLFLTTYLARSLDAEPFREQPFPTPHMECGNLFPLFPRAATVSAALFPASYLARLLHAEPFREQPFPTPQLANEMDYVSLRLAILLSPEGTYLNQPGVEPMRAVRATRNPGFAFRRFPQCRPRQEPRKTRNTRKVGKDDTCVLLPVQASRCLPQRRLRRVFAEGDQHRMVTIQDPWQRHVPTVSPFVLPPAAANRTGETIHGSGMGRSSRRDDPWLRANRLRRKPTR